MDQPAATTIAMTRNITNSGLIFEETISKIVSNVDTNLQNPVACVNPDVKTMLYALVCGVKACSSQDVKKFSRKGRMKILQSSDFIDDVTVDVFPGEICNLTLCLGIPVPKDKKLRAKYLAKEDVGTEWMFSGKTIKTLFIPLSIIQNISYPNNTVKFFDTPIPRCPGAVVSLRIECVKSCAEERERFVSIKRIMVADHLRPKIDPLTSYPNLDMLFVSDLRFWPFVSK